MFEPSLSINWLAVLASGLALQALGAAWYMALVPKAYARALGRDDLAGRKPAPIFIVGPLVCGVVVTITNAVLMRSLAISTISGALIFAVVTGVGYLVAMTTNVAINPNIPRPIFYAVVNGPYFLIANMVSCTLIVALH